MATMETLDELLREELKDIYDAEKQLTKALPKLSKKATSAELKQAFDDHLQQTEEHVDRLEQIFERLEMPMRGKKCEGMKHLVAEGDEMIGDADDDEARDAVMIASAQKVEHYEIASYGTMRTWATLLGYADVASLLEETLEEEKEADQKLTAIAEQSVNDEAAHPAGKKKGGPSIAGHKKAISTARSRQSAADRKPASRTSRR